MERYAVGVAEDEHRPPLVGGLPGERSADDGLGQVVRRRDPAVSADEKGGLPDSGKWDLERDGNGGTSGVCR